jgi:hypothetical protein
MSGLPELAGEGFDLSLVQPAAYGVEEDFHVFIPINGEANLARIKVYKL